MIDETLAILRAGGAVNVGGGYELGTRRYQGYEGRNPRTGEPVTVASKTLPHLSRSLGGSKAEAPAIMPRAVLEGAPVWHLPGIGFLVGFTKGDRSDLRMLLSFASFKRQVDGQPPPAGYIAATAVRAALAPVDAVERLVALGSGVADGVDAEALAIALGAPLSPDVHRVTNALAGLEVPPFSFAHPARRDDLPGVTFAFAENEGSWHLVLDDGPRVVAAGRGATASTTLDGFVGQAALVAAVRAARGVLTLSEDDALEVVRAMLAITPTFTGLIASLPL